MAAARLRRPDPRLIVLVFAELVGAARFETLAGFGAATGLAALMLESAIGVEVVIL